MWGRLLDKQTSLQPKELKLLAELKRRLVSDQVDILVYNYIVK